MQTNKIKPVMDVEEVASYLSLGTTKIYQLIKSKKIPVSRIDKQYLFVKLEIDKWLIQDMGVK